MLFREDIYISEPLLFKTIYLVIIASVVCAVKAIEKADTVEAFRTNMYTNTVNQIP